MRPRIVAHAATADRELLPGLTAAAAATVLPGHGTARFHGIRSAVARAQAMGAH